MSRQFFVVVATNIILLRQTYFCRDKTRLLSRQKYAYGRKHTFVATKDAFCRDKHVFVATESILVAAPADDTSVPCCPGTVFLAVLSKFRKS